MSVVHVVTRIQAQFAVLDDDGNATPQPPVTVVVDKFDAGRFAEAFAMLRQKRDELATEATVLPNGDGE